MYKIAVAIRHLAFEDLGAFQPELEARGFIVHYVDIGLNNLHDLEERDPDLLIVLGGPIGADDEEAYPFLLDELRIIARRVDAGRPLIGICLGAQLIARALGSKVYPGPKKEIGFAPVSLTEEGKTSCLSAVGEECMLHWHGDTFDLPRGSTLLASTKTCENQAFSYGNNVIGFQFHPEMGTRGFERWLIGHAAELNVEGISIAELRNDHQRFSPAMDARAAHCINAWLDQIE